MGIGGSVGKGEGEGEGERKGRERVDVVHGMGRCLHVLLTCFRLAGGWDGKRCVRGDGRCVSFSWGRGIEDGKGAGRLSEMAD